ncbi:hypothetical protein E4T56_gene14708 [Termitomyces sp. T112]|nr:hypothetical protein E4T56_gene14708 [Termitomyces sp. T112]
MPAQNCRPTPLTPAEPLDTAPDPGNTTPGLLLRLQHLIKGTYGANNDAPVAPTPQHKSPPAPNPAPMPEYVRQTGTTSLEHPELQEPPPLLRNNSAALQKTPLRSSPSDLRRNPTHKLRPNPNPRVSSGPLTPSSARTSPKANTTNKPPPSDPGVDSGTAQFFSDEGTPDPQEGTTLGTSPKASLLRRAIPQPTPALPLPKRNIHQHNSNRPPNLRECQKYPPPPTTTLGPPHCITNAPPTTSPITPFPAATPEAEPWTPASNRPEST